MVENVPRTNFSDGTMTGDANQTGDDGMFSGAYGWIFSLATAFGLLIFLAYSFVCYHRRLATRKAREDEYAEFLRIFRPDLDSKGLKQPRATINAYSASVLASSWSKQTSNAYINEGFEFGSQDERANTMIRENNHRAEDDIDYIIHSELQLQKKFTKNDSNHYGNLPESRGGFSENGTQSNSITTASVHTSALKCDTYRDTTLQVDTPGSQHTDKSDERTVSVINKHLYNECDEKSSQSDNPNTNDSAQVKHKPPVASRPPSVQFEAEALNDSQSQRNKKLKKKRQTYEQSATRKAALSFDEDVPYLFDHYTVPRRQSEPGTFLYEYNDASEIEKLKKERVDLNPYYAEMGTRLEHRPSSHLHRHRRNTRAHLEPIVYNTYRHQEADCDLKAPVPEELMDVYDGDIAHSTWM